MITVEKQFFRQFVSIYRPLLNRLNAMLAPYGMYNSQYSILNLLWMETEMTPFEIAKRQHVEKPTISPIIQKLHSMGLIEMNPGKTDRREKWLRLSEEGMKVCEDINGQLQVLYEEWLADVDKKDIETSLAVLNKIYHAIDLADR